MELCLHKSVTTHVGTYFTCDDCRCGWKIERHVFEARNWAEDEIRKREKMYQLDQFSSLACVVGYLTGLQKNPEIFSVIAKQLGGEDEAERFAESLFKIAESFYK